jgi:hypothetical protein
MASQRKNADTGKEMEELGAKLRRDFWSLKYMNFFTTQMQPDLRIYVVSSFSRSGLFEYNTTFNNLFGAEDADLDQYIIAEYSS